MGQAARDANQLVVEFPAQSRQVLLAFEVAEDPAREEEPCRVRHTAEPIPRRFEWETLPFFAGLFIMIGAPIKTGVIDNLARLAAEATGGNALLAVFLVLGVSALLSCVIDNIPYVATMIPLALAFTHDISNPAHSQALWWSRALGGDLTAVGASANVVMLGISARANSHVTFWEFTAKDAVITLITILVAASYLRLRCLVPSSNATARRPAAT
ncbi:SLC13 family permease [Amycolatopsis sp. NPDC051903]|uniref:SLC13 family permease n=1 Tax=Amycolatopsis sp. NPDC051903 TaxID=3363936 RepID=UPI0037BD62FD